MEYKSKLTLLETEIAIKKTKDFFEEKLAEVLNLKRVSAPLFVRTDSGLNDNLNGFERPVSFEIKDDLQKLEIVHSLAKWKRIALYKYGVRTGRGIYTDMDAIRRDEILDNTHSIYVDQWDWEKIISKEQRTTEYLYDVVKDIYRVFKALDAYLQAIYPVLTKKLPEDIFFISSEELLQRYPNENEKRREYLITKEYRAVFITQIGKTLSNGRVHDTRSPDYDDWDLNGDLLFYDELLDIALELSSMGIRVDKKSLVTQLEKTNSMDRINLPYHKLIRDNKLPYTIGGGIGQSRICMFFLEKYHIGEVQASYWTKEILNHCKDKGINLL